jgi:hypothetical protein
MCPHLPIGLFGKRVGEAVEMDGREIEVSQSNREAVAAGPRQIGRSMLLDEVRPARSFGACRNCGIRSRHPSGEDRLMLVRKIEPVEPLIDVSREDRIARHPVGEFRMVERRVRMDWA